MHGNGKHALKIRVTSALTDEERGHLDEYDDDRLYEFPFVRVRPALDRPSFRRNVFSLRLSGYSGEVNVELDPGTYDIHASTICQKGSGIVTIPGDIETEIQMERRSGAMLYFNSRNR